MTARRPTLAAAGSLLIVAGVGLFAVTYLRVVVAERTQRRDRDEVPRADAIVVFGGKCYERGPTIEVRERLDHAISLWEDSAAPVVLLSGGLDGDVDEVEIMHRYAIKRGVPETALGEARPGDDTRRTIAGLAQDRTYIAVSSAYHARRLESEARRQGRQFVVDCAPDTIEIRNRRVRRVQRVSEAIGCLVYASPPSMAEPARRLTGRLRHAVPELLTPR